MQAETLIEPLQLADELTALERPQFSCQRHSHGKGVNLVREWRLTEAAVLTTSPASLPAAETLSNSGADPQADPVVLRLRLQELLALPLEPGSRAHLWKLALERLPREALAQRRTLQLVLSRQAAQACEQWVAAGRWGEALTCARQQGIWLAELASENPPLAEVCRRDTAVLLRLLIQGLHRDQDQPDCPPQRQAEVCRIGWQLVVKLRALGQPEPEALGVIEEQLVRHGALAWRTLAETLAGEASIAALDSGIDMALALMSLYVDQEGHAWTQNLPAELLATRRQLQPVPPERLLNWLAAWLPSNPSAAAALASARRCQTLLAGIKRSSELAELANPPAAGDPAPAAGLQPAEVTRAPLPGQLAQSQPLTAGSGQVMAEELPEELAEELAMAASLQPQPPQQTPSIAAISGEELRQELRLDEGGIEGLRRRLARALKRWSDRPGQGPLTIDLGFRPGASLLEGDGDGLQLNLAPLLRCGDDAEVMELLELLDRHLETLERSAIWRANPEALLKTLNSHWKAGGQLHASQCRALAAVVKLRGPARVELPARAGGQLLRPAPEELALLAQLLRNEPLLVEQLSEIRRHHHDREWMESEQGADWPLRRLHTGSGFYASSHDPLHSLRRWSDATMGALRQHGLVLDSGNLGAALPLLQSLAAEGVSLPLQAWPERGSLDELMADQEVLLVAPGAAEIEAHHRRVASSQLDPESPMPNYGLRCLESPDSIHPRRPSVGFEHSLESLLEQVEQAWGQRAFQVFIIAAGAYSLPTCYAVEQRHGATCLALGSDLLEWFLPTAAAQTP